MAEPRVFGASGGVWAQLRVEAMQAAAEEPLLASYLHASILHHDRVEDALSYHLAQKLGHGDLPALQLREVIRDAYASEPQLAVQATRDMRVVRERDPAWPDVSAAVPLLQGLWRLAILSHRQLALAPRARNPRLSFADPRLRTVRRRHPSAADDRRGRFHRPRPRHSHRRDGGGGGRRSMRIRSRSAAPARPAATAIRRFAAADDRRGRQSAWPYRSRRGRAHCGGLGRAGRRRAALYCCRRTAKPWANRSAKA